MARTRLSAVTDTLRSGLEDAQGRAGDIAEVIAEKVGDAIEVASEQSRLMSKKLGKEWSKRWKVADRPELRVIALSNLSRGVTRLRRPRYCAARRYSRLRAR